MINFYCVKKRKHKKKHDPNWPQTSDHPYRILTIEGSRSGKLNTLFNLKNRRRYTN